MTRRPPKSKASTAGAGRSRRNKGGGGYGIPGQGDTLVISAITATVLIAIWSMATWLGWIRPLFLPSPLTIFRQFLQLLDEGFSNSSLLEHIWISFVRVSSALILACVTGVPVGLAMGMNRVARGIFDPPIESYRPVPPLAYLPLMIVWFGIGELSKILLIYLSIFAPVAIGARAGVRSAAIEQIHAAYSLGANRRQVLSQVILPAALPEIITAIRIGTGIGWSTLVAAEMVAATNGIGFMILSASEFLQTSTVIVGIILISTIAYAFDLVLRLIEHRLVPWKGKA
jgi:taurine transport system permease protein